MSSERHESRWSTKESISTEQEVYVIEGLKIDLLGFPPIKELNILQQLDTLVTVEDVKSHFPSIFSGLGILGGDYKIEQRQGAIPYALYTPRTVPIPL